jgi:tetratricopeptide (TPR) repeat protein
MSQVNDMHVLPKTLTLVSNAMNLTEDELRSRFASVQYFNGLISTAAKPRAIDYFGRAMDYLLLRNVDAAIADATRALEMTPDFSLGYFLRFNARQLKHEMEKSTPAQATLEDAQAQAMLSSQRLKTEYAQMLDDINMVIKLSPRNTYAYYNLAHLQASMEDYSNALINYSKAINLKPDLGEAYFNRGLIHMQLGDKEKGTADLSKAGELGILPSYNILKRMSNSQ